MRIIAAGLILIGAAVFPVGNASASSQDCYFRALFTCVDPYVTAEPAKVAPGGKVAITSLVRCDWPDVPRVTSRAFTAPVILSVKPNQRYFNVYVGTATVSSKAKAGVTPITATCSGKYSVTGTLQVLPARQVPSKPKSPGQVAPKPKGAVQTGGGGTAER